jgi:UDP-N-acetylmuramoylalanine--D-glutamate ligase
VTGPGEGAAWDRVAVLVAGVGVSGVAAARALAALGARVTAVDAGTGERQQQARADLERLGATVRLGEGAPDPAALAGHDLVVTSPGWRPDTPLLTAAAAAGLPVWGEVELAWRLRPPGAPAPWLCLTGTNGKTTTVRMLAAILAAAGRRAVATGNVGLALLDAVLADPPYDVLAVELSSFQLHWARSLRPQAAAILNIAPDHVDWHGSIEAYAAAKGTIYAGAERACIANAADPRTVTLATGAAARSGARLVTTTAQPPEPGQLGVRDAAIVDRAFTAGADGDADAGGGQGGGEQGDGVELAALTDVRPFAPHNVENALAAAALARAHGVPPEAVRAGLRAFVPDPHRNAVVASVAGVTWVDDSKATNPHAAAASLRAYGSVVWVAGGLAKGASFDELVAGARDRLRAAVLLGRDRDAVRAALARHAPHVPVMEVTGTETGAMDAMDSVVSAAAGLAHPGDTVLLAPACASMDMFRDYTARGQAFAAAVARHAATAAAEA